MKYAMSILVLLIMSYSAPIFGQHIVAIRWGGNMTKIGGFDSSGYAAQKYEDRHLCNHSNTEPL